MTDPIPRTGLAPRFWERKPLSKMSPTEWEALCDGCGKCCLNKLEDDETGEVLMMAWMNREALEHTLASGNVTYWSRSRAQLWRKGETSGNHQRLVKLRIDCDGDTLLCDVEQVGPACHTGRSNCFYLSVDRHKNSVTLDGE